MVASDHGILHMEIALQILMGQLGTQNTSVFAFASPSNGTSDQMTGTLEKSTELPLPAEFTTCNAALSRAVYEYGRKQISITTYPMWYLVNRSASFICIEFMLSAKLREENHCYRYLCCDWYKQFSCGLRKSFQCGCKSREVYSGKLMLFVWVTAI